MLVFAILLLFYLMVNLQGSNLLIRMNNSESRFFIDESLTAKQRFGSDETCEMFGISRI